MSPLTLRGLVPYFLGIPLFIIYLITAAPTVYLGDSGELIAAAFSLGIPHNSGYPLYSMLGKLFCLIPLGNIGFRMNLMSAVFSVLTIGLVCSIILRMTSSILASVAASAFLAFTPLFWNQTVFAEVYPLHTFFVALMIRVLLWWDDKKEFKPLCLFVFITGLSFANHMQTLMLAPAVLLFIIWGDRKALFNLEHFGIIALLFFTALSLYLYLPLRTNAGAAIHWGDPNTLERFLAHVTARSHRGAYVFSKGFLNYLERSGEFLGLLWSEYGIIILISFWGWLKLSSVRWKVFFLLVIVFDFIYTVFLNIVPLQITPFGLPTLLVSAILFGFGIHVFLVCVNRQPRVSAYIRKTVYVGLLIIPCIPLFLNRGLCDQSRNYTAYEHAVNIFRTVKHASNILLEGDNNVFPVLYGRIVENMGTGVTLYDRHNLLFKWDIGVKAFRFEGTWDEFLAAVEEKIIRNNADDGMYFAAFNPLAISIPTEYCQIPYGILTRVVPQSHIGSSNGADTPWNIYYSQSFEDGFFRDYMNREVCSYYYFKKGQALFLSGDSAEGLDQLKLASMIAYDDTSIHSEIAIFLTERGFFEEARKELQKALVYSKKSSSVHNNWGYYFHKRREYKKAVKSFRKAIELNPKNHIYFNNLGFALYKLGRPKDAMATFQASLSIKEDQPKIVKFIKTHGLL